MINAAFMPLWALILLFICGLILIMKGGDLFVDAAVWIAEISGVPQFVIGATVVSFATTIPELIVSCIGAARGSNEIAIGNAIGSVTANTGLIMAISIICIPAAAERRRYAFKSVMLILAAAVVYASAAGGRFSKAGGAVLLVIFAASIYESLKTAKGDNLAAEKPDFSRAEIPANIAKFIFGTAGIIFGADFLVASATEIAAACGVPEEVISATVVAVGTSLPELVTTVTAIVKKQSSLSVGNIIGANLIDISVILPVCSLISSDGLTACPQNIFTDMPACILVLCIALLPMLFRGRFTRLQGFVLLAVYTAYVLIITIL